MNTLQGEAGKAQRSKHDQQHRDNLVRLRGEKQRDIDRLRTGLEACQACLAVSQGKEQTLTSRKRMLEKEVRHGLLQCCVSWSQVGPLSDGPLSEAQSV